MLYTSDRWKAARPESVVFLCFIHSAVEPGKVESVQGFIKTKKRILLSDGRYCLKNCCLQAVWNSDGHCYVGNFRKRRRKYDIPLDQQTNEPKRTVFFNGIYL